MGELLPAGAARRIAVSGGASAGADERTGSFCARAGALEYSRLERKMVAQVIGRRVSGTSARFLLSGARPRLATAVARPFATAPAAVDGDDDGHYAYPTQAIILAAGLGTRLRPFTEEQPKCFVPVAGKPMVEHTAAALQRSGVDDFVVVRGYKGEVFDTPASQAFFAPSKLELVTNEHYESTEVLQSLLVSREKWQDGGFYVAYSDIVFADSVMQDLREAEGDICIVIDRDFRKIYNGRRGHPYEQCEAVTLYERGWAKGTVDQLGKGKVPKIEDCHGEMIGLMKVSERGAAALDAAAKKIGDELAGRDWKLDKLYLTDLLQRVVDDGEVKVMPVDVYGNWREVDTPYDLQRANNVMHYLNDQEGRRSLVHKMGKALLSEANDLKRPLPIVAQEMDVELGLLDAMVDGKVEVDTAYELVRSMSATYPVSLADMWMETDDTDAGVRVFTAAESEATERVLSREDKDGERTPYYAYRDSAMSRLAPFRPEWIEELRVVEDNDPHNPDVQYNNGHLMMQTTFFIGPVNFYYELRGKKYCFEANTGDSNFISPFVPHSFASRDPSQQALIIAVTYGGAVRSALTDFSRMPLGAADELSGDARDVQGQRVALIARQMMAESTTALGLATRLQDTSKMGLSRALDLIQQGAEPTADELDALAASLNVLPREIEVSEAMHHREEIVITRRSTGDSSSDSLAAAASNDSEKEEPWVTSEEPRLFPEDATAAKDAGCQAYIMRPLARTVYQPSLKTFDIGVLPTGVKGMELKSGLHQFLYCYGDTPVQLEWGPDFSHSRVLQPGDSAYVAPTVPHRFTAEEGETQGQMYAVRIPGNLTTETWREFSMFQPNGRERVGNESMRWYN